MTCKSRTIADQEYLTHFLVVECSLVGPVLSNMSVVAWYLQTKGYHIGFERFQAPKYETFNFMTTVVQSDKENMMTLFKPKMDNFKYSTFKFREDSEVTISKVVRTSAKNQTKQEIRTDSELFKVENLDLT